MDVISASVLLVLSAPALAVIAVAIRIDSPGPVLFRQDRVGRHGRRFEILKFRSMVDGAGMALNPDGSGNANGTPIDSYTPTNYQDLQNADLDLGRSGS